MGLPSGVRWASCNVGAARPSDLGLYFSWGNIEGHRVGEEYDFSRAVYDSTPAAMIGTDLSLSQDAARANLGEPWRMPSTPEFQELIDNCTRRWETVNGVNGILLISNVNGNTLFFPAAGYFVGETLRDRNNEGYYWALTYSSATGAKRLRFGARIISAQNNSPREEGFPVRAVMKL